MNKDSNGLSYTILIYSKYSDNSAKLTNLITSNNLQIPIQYLCIDNKDVRNRILSSSKIKIKLVPSILNVFNNGVVQLYEGNYAFQFINNLIDTITPPPPVMPEQNIVDNKIHNDEVKIKNTKKSSFAQDGSSKDTDISNLNDLFDDDDNESIEDDITIGDDSSSNVKPKKGVRIDKTNEDFDNNYFDDEQPCIMDGSAKLAVRNSASNKHVHEKKDIQSKAQDLAKEREIEEQKIKKKRI
jgi:hypothetical protein